MAQKFDELSDKLEERDQRIPIRWKRAEAAGYIKIDPSKPDIYQAHRPKFVRGHYSRKQRKVIAKVMYQAGWGADQLALWFYTTPGTITKNAKRPTPEALKTFEAEFRMAMQDANMQGLALVTHRLTEAVKAETKIEPLIKAGEFFRGDRKPGTSNNTQVNVYQDLLKKYGEDGVVQIPVKVETKRLK